MLAMKEQKVLGKIFGGGGGRGDMGRGTNQELNELYGEAIIVRVVKAQTLRWMGNMVDLRMPKMIMPSWVKEEERPSIRLGATTR